MDHYNHCKVKHCRYSYTHTTSGHKCGVIGCTQPYGHGQIEHYNKEARDNLKSALLHKLPIDEHCTITGCNYSWNHTTKSHYCKTCNRYGLHHHSNCIIQPLNKCVEQWNLDINKIEQFINTQDDIIFQIYVGMGCHVFISHKNNNTNTIFMHSDCWGQYGPETDDSKVFQLFSDGLTNITNHWTNFNEPTEKKCPICRTLNMKDDIKFIKGLDAKCVVCLDNNIEVYFSACEHSVVCKSCLLRI